MVLLSIVWGMVSVTTKEIVPPSNKPKTVSPFRLLSFSFFTLNNKRVKLTKAAGWVHCFLRAPEEFPQHHLVTGPSCLFSRFRFRSYSSISGSRRNQEKRQWTLQERGQLLMILREEWLSHRLLMLWLCPLEKASLNLTGERRNKRLTVTQIVPLKQSNQQTENKSVLHVLTESLR